MKILKKYPVICWWSGGITSAVACKIAIDTFHHDNCRVIMIDTKNEHSDTYRFKADCEEWYGVEIETITAIGKKYNSIEDVWYEYESLNVAHGAICSSELKIEVRKDFQRKNKYSYQVFGFDFIPREFNRAKNMKNNYLSAHPIFPLLMFGYSKADCLKIVERAGIQIPYAYKLGFDNNNCLKTGCVQGGIGYWKKYRKIFPFEFDEMAEREHELTDLKGKPVTICKDQSKQSKLTGNTRVFLKPHPDYPHVKDITMIKTKGEESMPECNGFCGVKSSVTLSLF